jgi:ELWxxDGT repeat protein
MLEHGRNSIMALSYFDKLSGATSAQLWVTDGTLPGTHLVASVGSAITRLTAIGSRVFFVVDDGTHGPELWTSDGSALGTFLVKDIHPGPSGSSFPDDLTNVNGTLYFQANDGAHGVELWKSNGTAAGTVMVRDIDSGSSGSGPGDLTNVNGELYFTANDGVHGEELWKSDGTAGGTVRVDVFPWSSRLHSRQSNQCQRHALLQRNERRGWRRAVEVGRDRRRNGVGQRHFS